MSNIDEILGENLLALNETKQAIKTAIENKGQDLTDVPFTSYADKIAEISSSGKNFTTGTVTFTSNSYKQTVTHNLGVKPSLVAMWVKDLSLIPESGAEETKGNAYKFFHIYVPLGNFNFGYTFQGNTSTGALSWQPATNPQSKVDETTFTTGAINSNYKFMANVEYEWIAIE